MCTKVQVTLFIITTKFGNEQQVELNPKNKETHDEKRIDKLLSSNRVERIICGKHVDWRAVEKATHK
jgi:hypothetical protein